jgi:predicted nucleotidyltransferase
MRSKFLRWCVWIRCDYFGRPYMIYAYHKKSLLKRARWLAKTGFDLVIPARFERATHGLEGRCSVQLSYGTSM